MHINKRQKIATAIIAPLFVLTVLFPPWRAVFFDQSVSWAPLWSPPPKSPMVVSFILLEWFGIFLFLAIVLLLLRSRNTSHERTNRTAARFMSFFSWLKKKAFGEVLQDFGELPPQHGWRVSVSLRQIREQRPYLLLRWEHGDHRPMFTSLPCTPEVYERLETIIHESRKRVGN